ncbi:hypothetical protein HNQ91_002014 [Filimonas zeae]|uniref:Uncharacterized protein n=1 Tax=Filimonas zeae TaxID=1737353 RepID=A0A917IW29_9BACT|nr:hypothetical protein [Filimonas zeae]MDR6338963.1 hypothetical protein [Filimonas zeae]GGH65755.1 hypothetical protein GCM10011379_19230 [Filimonas zeae]
MNQLSSITQRALAPTPVFFKKLRLIGLALLTISAAIAGIKTPLPGIITQVAGYIAVAGAVLSAVSQTTVEDKVKQLWEELPHEQQ